MLQDIESGGASELAVTDESATTKPSSDASGSSADPDSVERLSSAESNNTADDDTSAGSVEGKDKEQVDKRCKTKNGTGSGGDEGDDDSDGLAALAEEQRRLEEQDRLEHKAEMARMKK